MAKTFTQKVLDRAGEIVKDFEKDVLKAAQQDTYGTKRASDEEFLAWMNSMVAMYPPQLWMTPEGPVVESLWTLCLRRMANGKDEWKRWVRLTTGGDDDTG